MKRYSLIAATIALTIAGQAQAWTTPKKDCPPKATPHGAVLLPPTYNSDTSQTQGQGQTQSNGQGQTQSSTTGPSTATAAGGNATTGASSAQAAGGAGGRGGAGGSAQGGAGGTSSNDGNSQAVGGGASGNATNTSTTYNEAASRIPVNTAVAGFQVTTASCRFAEGLGIQTMPAGTSVGLTFKDHDCVRAELAQMLYSRGQNEAGDRIMCQVKEVKAALGDDCLTIIGMRREPLATDEGREYHPPVDAVTHAELLEVEKRMLVRGVGK